MAVDLRHLRYFFVVAEELSFSRAAQLLHITQPALSGSVRELEDELGVELLLRRGRGVSLSWCGEILHDEAGRILRMVDEAVRRTREAGMVGANVLRVGVIDHRRPGLVSKALARLRVLLPELRLTTYELPTADQILAIAGHQLDLGIVVGPVLAEGIAVEELWSERLVVVVSVAHRLASQDTAAASDLRNDVLIVPDRSLGEGYLETVVRLCESAGFSPRIGNSAHHLDTLLSMVEAGLGVGFVPESLDTTRSRAIVGLGLRDSSATIPVLAAWESSNDLIARSPLIAALKASRGLSLPDYSGI